MTGIGDSGTTRRPPGEMSVRHAIARISAAGFLMGQSQVDRFRLHGDLAR
jgi:hypothetical protein